MQTANTYVNTGMQTSPRMWLESIRNWINDILGTPNPNPNYVDVGVQTSNTFWETVKQFFIEVCSIRPSDLSSLIGKTKIVKRQNELDSVQSVDLNNSDSPLTTLKFGSDSELENLVDPNDSASNVSEVVSESNQQNAIVYNITDPGVLNLYMHDETVDFEVIDNVYYAVTGNIYLSIDPAIYTLFI